VFYETSVTCTSNGKCLISMAHVDLRIAGGIQSTSPVFDITAIVSRCSLSRVSALQYIKTIILKSHALPGGSASKQHRLPAAGPKISGGATLWQSSANALPVCCHALPVALLVFLNKKAKTMSITGLCYCKNWFNSILALTCRPIVSVYRTISNNYSA